MHTYSLLDLGKLFATACANFEINLLYQTEECKGGPH